MYAASLQGAVSYWDTGEMQVVPWIFGIAHPTGFPAFTILAGAFAHLFPAGTVAWRIAFFSALAMSGGAWLVYRCVVELDGEPFCACAAAWLFAFGDVVWMRGTRAEVHALALFFAMLTLYGALRWQRRGERSAAAGTGLAFGLGVATHPIVVWLLPALIVLALRPGARTRTFAAAAAASLLGFLCYAYLPLRSWMVTVRRLDPTRSIGEPPGNAFWDTDHPSTLAGLRLMLSGDQFGADSAIANMAAPQTYVERFPAFAQEAVHDLTPLGLLFALGGVYALFRTAPRVACALLLAAALPTAFAFGYTIEADVARYYLIALGVGAIFAGVAASAIARALPALRLQTAALLAAAAVASIVLNRSMFAQAYSSGAQDVIQTVQAKTADDAILISPWMFATPLAYASYVDRSLGHRIVQSAWLGEVATRIPSWTRKRPVYVVGTLSGSVPGYTAFKISGSPDLYRLVKK